MNAVLIDDRVKHIGISKIRQMNTDFLREFARTDNLIVLRESDEPLAVLVPYAQYLELLNKAQAESRRG